MAIGHVRPQDPSEPNTLNDTSPPTQDHERDQEDEQDEDQAHDQGGDKNDGDHQGSWTKPPHLRVYQTVQRDHPVYNILGDIKKGVTTRSRVANFYKHYWFISSLEPFKVEDALRDPDWVVAMKKNWTTSSAIKYDLWLKNRSKMLWAPIGCSATNKMNLELLQ
jgi:hypothetical protein